MKIIWFNLNRGALEFHYQIKPCIIFRGNCQMCVKLVLARGALSPAADETTVLVLPNVKKWYGFFHSYFKSPQRAKVNQNAEFCIIY